MSQSLLSNPTARYDYTILKTYQAGVVLSGAEVKSLRQKAGSLKGSFVKLLGGEAFLVNAQINNYPFATNPEYDPKRSRKLLLKKKELLQLAEALAQGAVTLVPLAIFTAGPHIKLELGLGKGKKQFEKRAEIRKRDLIRQEQRSFKESVRIK